MSFATQAGKPSFCATSPRSLVTKLRSLSWGAVLVCLCLLAYVPASAQNQNQTAVSKCYREDTLPIIEHQVYLTRSFDRTLPRVAVLLRAADLLWPYKQGTARAAFVESFELATRDAKERLHEGPVEGTKRLTIVLPDPRYQVIAAIARRDSAWARQLTNTLLNAEGEAGSETKERGDDNSGEKLLLLATRLVDSNPSVALTFARNSLRYKANLILTTFLYRLAEANQQAADEFYRQAVTTYANSPGAEFLYLSAYPFGLDRAVGDLPTWTTYSVPAGFKTNPALQRLFVQAMFQRTQQLVTSQNLSVNTNGRLPATGNAWLALSRLEPIIAGTIPDLLDATRQAEQNLLSTLTQTDRQEALELLNAHNLPDETFEGQIEKAEHEEVSDRRDNLIATALLNFKETTTLERMVNAAEKLTDSDVRTQLLDWIYFNHAQQSIKGHLFEEARNLSAKIQARDQRAYLNLEIARASLKDFADQSEVRILLEEVAAEAKKAPDTNIKARTLLGLASVYASLDATQALSLLGEAVKTVNHIDSPDLSRDSFIRKIEAKTFALYATVQTTGFTPEASFREVAKQDLDGTLYLIGTIEYKPLRALTTLAVVEKCLATSRMRSNSGTRK